MISSLGPPVNPPGIAKEQVLPDPQMAVASVPVRVPSPGEGVWSPLSALKFFLMDIIF